jgi:hypothetical protein
MGQQYAASEINVGETVAAQTTTPPPGAQEAASPGASVPQGDAATPGVPAPDVFAEPAPGAVALKPADTIAIERGACFGPCPVYKATAYGDDRLVFEGRKFVRAEGVHERRMAAGGFERLVGIARRHEFSAMDSKWPDETGLNCPEPPTDMPSVTVTIATGDINHSVSFYSGCRGNPGADRVAAMVEEIDRTLALDDLVGPREDWYGRKKDR